MPSKSPPDTDENLAPVTSSELDVLRRELAEYVQQSRAKDDELARVSRELKENQRLVEKLMESGETGLDMVALEAKWKARETARRKIYDYVRGKKVIIQFHAERDPNRNTAVHVNLNGHWYNIPRGKPFELEGEFLEVIDHAVVQTLTREVDFDGNPHTVIYDLFLYPYQILSGLEGMTQSDRISAMSAAA